MSTFVHSDAIGVVVEFKRKGNFGFIRPSDMSDPCLDDIDDVFFHISDVPNRSIEPGDEVWFDLHLGPKGYFAKDITFQTSDDEDSVSDSEEYFLEEGVQGVVTQYRERSRFGFIHVNDTYSKVFFHISKVEGEDIEVGDKVELDLYLGPKGYFAEGITFPTSDDEDFVESGSDSEELIQGGVQGFVTRYGTKSRYGFIHVNDTFNKVFFHISEVSGDYIEVGDEVEFDLCVGPKGYFAETIEVLNLESGDDDSDSESDADDETANEETLLASNATGVVKRYLNRRRFGFIKSDHGDTTYNKIFFHISAVSYQPVAIHDTVQFDLYVGPKGYFAKSVTFNSPTRVDTDCTEIGLGQNVGSLGGYNLLQGTEKKNDHKESTANYSSCAGSTGTTNFETSRISREKGNAFFKQAREHDSGKSKMAYYLNALECYKKAYTSSSKDEDLVSAAKNTGTTCWKLAKLKMEENSSELKVVHAYFKDTLQYFKIAYVKRSCMVDEWSNHLEKSIKECLNDIKAWVAPRNDQERIRVLKEFVDYMPESGAKVSCYLHIANIYFRNGKDAIKEREYNGCLRYA
ncbi:uncharacterized protein LOC121430292 [Lytechinus variegatus]|uniref:uncharacterized protein LOC121430292 n=1 Tax=Lytechinus variegatus TaxID=7654 RepID=UPI001BB18491|nr:uncharacterized protein LOC121430292 [Lytechinus variegatus]